MRIRVERKGAEGIVWRGGTNEPMTPLVSDWADYKPPTPTVGPIRRLREVPSGAAGNSQCFAT